MKKRQEMYFICVDETTKILLIYYTSSYSGQNTLFAFELFPANAFFYNSILQVHKKQSSEKLMKFK